MVKWFLYVTVILCNQELKEKSPNHSIYIHAKSIFDEAKATNCKLVVSMRKSILETEPSLIRMLGYNYQIHTFYAKTLLSDFLRSVEFKYSNFQDSSYSNRFLSFLECNKYSLTRDNPRCFIVNYCKFFDNYLSKYLRKNFNSSYSKEVLDPVISKLLISTDLQVFLNREVQWCNISDLLDTVLGWKLISIDHVMRGVKLVVQIN